jgi:hypothetical protein
MFYVFKSFFSRDYFTAAVPGRELLFEVGLSSCLLCVEMHSLIKLFNGRMQRFYLIFVSFFSMDLL